ncbi:mandelate racemase/muconate lactonizing enzyme family protein [bacterium]|nr:mandelate racemase/muconate lactonizing enzyme family protein [bacterium]
MPRVSRIELFHVDAKLSAPFYPSWIPGYAQTHNRFTLIRVTTDDGLVGVSAGAAFTTEREGLGELLGGFLIGADALDIATVRQRLKEATYLGWRNWWIEPAFWDIRGKAEGKPVYKLVAGNDETVDELPCYASTGSLRPFDERKPYLDNIRRQGFRGVKIRVHSFSEDEDIDILRRVREEVGPDFQIMVDANQGWRVTLIDDAPLWDVERAVRFGKACDELGIAWIEEPLDMHDFDGYAEVRRQVKTPIAGGELFGSRQELRTSLEKGAFGILQPDATFAGGIEDARWAIAECRARGVGYSPHTWTNGIGLLINAHLKAAAKTPQLLEYPYEPPGWIPAGRDAILKTPWLVNERGAIALPQAPGLGIEIDDAALRRHAKRFHVVTPARVAIKTIREKGLKTALEIKKRKEAREG